MTTYGTTSGADDYHDARGNGTAWGAVSDPDAALLVASEYIDARFKSRFPGVKTDGRSQVREWPRSGAVDAEGLSIDSDEVPTEILNATYEAALVEGVTPGTLFGSVAAGAPVIKRLKSDVDEIEFALNGSTQARYPGIEAALTGLLGSTSQYSARLVRG